MPAPFEIELLASLGYESISVEGAGTQISESVTTNLLRSGVLQNKPKLEEYRSRSSFGKHRYGECQMAPT